MVNRPMTKKPSYQITVITAPRPTRAAALVSASLLSIPTFILLSLIDWLLL